MSDELTEDRGEVADGGIDGGCGAGSAGSESAVEVGAARAAESVCATPAGRVDPC